MSINYTNEPAEISRRMATATLLLQVVSLGFSKVSLACCGGETVKGVFLSAHSVTSPGANGTVRHGLVASLQPTQDPDWIVDVDLSVIQQIEGLSET